MDMKFDDGLQCCLHDEYYEDEFGCLTVADFPDRQPASPVRLHQAPPLIERLWRCALFDLEANWLAEGKQGFYAAGGRGQGWNGMVFTRDLAYAGVLGVNRLFPNRMRQCLEVTRRVRLQLGLRADRDNCVPDLPFVLEDISGAEFKEKYSTNPYPRRTDDVVWLWWADDLASRHFDNEPEWRWILDLGKRCFDQLYQPFFDPRDGLYFGQASFIDVGYNGYPESFGRGGIAAIRNCLRIKAASTNCLYYKGMTVMAKAAERCGLADEQREWGSRAEALRRAIRTRIVQPDGRVAYFLHPDEHAEPREHALATAFAVLLGVLDGEAAARACRHYPVAWWGAPLFHPFFANRECYHNHSAWPFATSLLLRAREKALGVNEAWRELALLVQSCRGDTFHEWTCAFDKLPHGKAAQMWTLGPFVGRCLQLFEPKTNESPADG